MKTIRCHICGKQLRVKMPGNEKNILKTHIINSCQKATDKQKQVWKMEK